MATEPWYAAYGTVYISSAITVADNTPIRTTVAAGSDESAMTKVKDIKFSGGTADVDVMNYLGSSSGTQGRVNQDMDIKRPSMKECTFTLTETAQIYSTTGETIGTLSSWSDDVATVVTGTTYRVRGGYGTSITKRAVFLQMTNGSINYDILLNNALMTVGDLTLNADGNMERSVTIKCLAQDFYEDSNNIA